MATPNEDKPKSKITKPAAPETDKETFQKRFLGTLTHILEDVTTLEVATYSTTGTGQVSGEGDIPLTIGNHIYQAHLQAYTCIKLDADTVLVLPGTTEGSNLVINQSVYNLHLKHIELAKQTRQEMISAMLGAISNVANIFG